MKKGIFSIVILLSCCAVFSGCIKTSPAVTTINPSMTANVGSYNFIASSTVPATSTSQTNDTATTLVVTGYSSDPTYPYDKMVITVTSYKGITNTYSMVQGQASGTYYHNGSVSYALGGIVSISRVTSNNIVGYFSFNTQDNLSISNGAFNVGLP